MIYKYIKYLTLISCICFSNAFCETAADATPNTCLDCHKENEMLPEDFSDQDVHMHAQLNCVGCHGGDATSDDPDESMSPAKGFVGVPSRRQIPQFCGKCHSSIEFMRKYQPQIPTDQVDQYFQSYHGKMLKKGDENVAVCTSCHNTHAILPVKDPRSSVHPFNLPATCNSCHGDADFMSGYNIPTDQFEKYSKSVHGIAVLERKDIGAPVCNTCHGTHGATPPGISSISNVCGSCHVLNKEYFSQSKMGHAFSDKNLHSCEECHGNHAIEKTTDKMIGTDFNAFCIRCHKEGDAGFMVADSIHRELAEVSNKFNTAGEKLQEIKIKAMNDLEIEYLLKEAKQNLVQTRTLVHTFDPVKIRKKTAEGKKILAEIDRLSEAEFKEYKIRRVGFGVAALAFVLLALALYLKIRQNAREQSL